jgi:hypothetical protein
MAGTMSDSLLRPLNRINATLGWHRRCAASRLATR